MCARVHVCKGVKQWGGWSVKEKARPYLCPHLCREALQPGVRRLGAYCAWAHGAPLPITAAGRASTGHQTCPFWVPLSLNFGPALRPPLLAWDGGQGARG